jgi:hypothetical protein
MESISHVGFKVGDKVKVFAERENSLIGTIEGFYIHPYGNISAVVNIPYKQGEDHYMGDAAFREKYGEYTISSVLVNVGNMAKVD